MKKILMFLSCMFGVGILKSAESFSIMQKHDSKSESLKPASSRFILSMYNHDSIKGVLDVAQADFWQDPIIQKNVGHFAVGSGNLFFVLRDALKAHKVCGFVRLSILSKYIHIHQLAIDKNYRGCGLAIVLLEEVEKLALDQKVFLQLAVYDCNIAAIQFYEKHNFKFL